MRGNPATSRHKLLDILHTYKMDRQGVAMTLVKKLVGTLDDDSCMVGDCSGPHSFTKLSFVGLKTLRIFIRFEDWVVQTSSVQSFQQRILEYK